MWSLILAIVLLSFSAFLTGYLVVFYTTSFKTATFAKTTSMVIGLIGIIILIIAIEWWWGFVGIVGYQILLLLSRIFWHKRYESDIKAGKNPYRTSNDLH